MNTDTKRRIILISVAAAAAVILIFGLVYGRNVSSKQDINIQLTDDKIMLQTGDKFGPASYIKSATDDEGNDVSKDIEVKEKINTNVPGAYIINYAYMHDGKKSAVKQMKVVVVEKSKLSASASASPSASASADSTAGTVKGSE